MKLKILVIIFIITLGACSTGKENTSTSDDTPSPNESQFDSDIGINYKNFQVGTSGFTPATKEKITNEIISEFWEQTELISDVHGVHVDWKDSDLIETTLKNTNLDLSIVLGFQDPIEWKNKVNEFVTRAKEILSNDRVKYLAIGNEVNTLNEKYPSDFNNFIKSYIEIYKNLKQAFPNKKIYTTFQYETLIGEGYLTGKSELESSLNILDELKDYIDLVGLTTYPMFDYAYPKDIPNNYYKSIREYSDKPIAFTETGWISRESFSGKFAALNEKGFSGSENEQIEFLKQFLELTKNEHVEFANWIFLDDIRDWKNGKSKDDGIFLFESIGLRNYDSSPKEIYFYWGTLQNLPFKSGN